VYSVYVPAWSYWRGAGHAASRDTWRRRRRRRRRRKRKRRKKRRVRCQAIH
jgi:hypothetical protein